MSASTPAVLARRGALRTLGLAVLRERKARTGAILLGVFALLGLLGPLFTVDPDALVGMPHQAPSWAHWLGTTGQGQDVFAQWVWGTRLSLLIGFAVGLCVVAVGGVLGIAAGYAGGWLDAALSLFTNVFLVIPGLPLAIVLAAYLPAGPLTIGLVLVVTGWAWNARVLRAQTLALRRRDFISAAIVAGERPVRIVLRELLPNMTSVLVAQAIGGTIYAIGAQVGLEFLGLGDVSTVTWGTTLYWATNDSALLTGAWWTYLPGGLSIALVGFALTLLGSGFDEVTNPRLEQERLWRRALRALGQRPQDVTPVKVRHG